MLLEIDKSTQFKTIIPISTAQYFFPFFFSPCGFLSAQHVLNKWQRTGRAGWLGLPPLRPQQHAVLIQYIEKKEGTWNVWLILLGCTLSQARHFFISCLVVWCGVCAGRVWLSDGAQLRSLTQRDLELERDTDKERMRGRESEGQRGRRRKRDRQELQRQRERTERVLVKKREALHMMRPLQTWRRVLCGCLRPTQCVSCQSVMGVRTIKWGVTSEQDGSKAWGEPTWHA